MNTQHSIHQFTIKGINGKEIDFASFEGKKLLVVNVASECGLTPQYAQLQELYEQFGNRVNILGCPANNFGGQEPGSHEQIQTFCSTNFGVTFPLTIKISVKGGNMHPLYQWLTQASQNGNLDSEVGWNFQKYLLDEDGRLVACFDPTVEPFADEIMDALGISL